MYKHICDECGKLFNDDRDELTHCYDDNGLVVCDTCKNKLKENGFL